MRRCVLKVTLILFVSVLLVSCFSSCKEDEELLGTITGFVVDADTGEPVRTANITLNPSGSSTVSGSDGRYEFLDLESGTYTVQASKTGYISNTKTVVVNGVRTSTGDIMLTPSSSDMTLSVNQIDFGVSGTIAYFQIANNASNGSIQWSIVKQGTANWLTVSPVSGTTGAGQQSRITLTADRTNLTTSSTVNLVITNNTSGNSITLPVSISYNSEVMQVTPNPVDFGTSATSRQITLHNSGYTAISYEIDYNCSWLTVSPTSGTIQSGSNATVSLSLNRNAFSGNVETILQVRNANDGSTTPVRVTASNNGGGLQVTPNPVDFGTSATSRQITLHNSGYTAIPYEIDYNCSWLTVSPTSGTIQSGSNATVFLSLNRNAFSGNVETILQVRNVNDGSTTSVRVTAANNGGGSDDIVVSNGLMAYYTFDNGTANDMTDNNADAQIMNGATMVSDGNGGYYLSISSTQGGYMHIPYNFFSGYSYWTVSFWIKDLTAGCVFAAMNSNNGNGYDRPTLWADQGGLLTIFLSNAYNHSDISYNYSNNSGLWHHYVIVRDGGTTGSLVPVRFYVDGTLIDNLSVSSTATNGTKINFGGDKNGSYGIAPSMKIDNIRFYGRTLSTNEIQTIYNNER